MVTQNKCEISIPAILKVEKDILGQVGKYLADMNPIEAMDFVKSRLENTKDNEEFLMSMNS